ncbi:MAG: phosphate/phosphite/phosphonate ABC transporter substrate-binding protein [Woeseiaceae bacterium]
MINRSILLLIIMLSSFFTANIYAKEEHVYLIGVVPQFEIRHLRKIWNPIISEIKKKTGIKLKLIGSPNIPDFEREFNNGKFDFAYMNPYHVILANKSQSYIPLVRDNGRKLHGILVVKKGSKFKSIKDLDGKKVAFPAPNSLGASLLIRADLKNKYHIDIHPVYVKTHSSVYLNVVVNQAAAGGAVQKTLNQQKENIKSALHVLYRTPKVAPHPLAAHPRVPAKVVKAVKNALLLLGENETGKALLANIPMKKIGSASMADYTPLLKLNLDQFYAK